MTVVTNLKILYLIHDSRRSGVPAVAASFIREAASVGVEPTVIFACDGVYSEELRTAGIRVETMGKRTPLLWRAKRFLMNWYLLTIGSQFDIIHIHSVKLAWSVLVARWLGLRVIYHLHELPRCNGWLLRTAMARADAVVFCSDTCAAHFYAIPVKMRKTIVNALKFSDKPPVWHEGKGKRVVMAASINRGKGQDLLLKAFARLKNESAELWLYGTTGLSARRFVRGLKNIVREQGLEKRVFFPGPTADALKVFAEASVVVHPSWTESFGMALVEAQSCGVPVIAHDLEGMREVVVDGVSGYLVKPGDVAELTQRLDALLENPDVRNCLGAAGYAMVRERFNIGQRVYEYEQLYHEVLIS